MAAAPAAASVLGGFHPVLFGVVLCVAVFSFGPAIARHRDFGVFGLAMGGLILLFLAMRFDEGVLETMSSVAGALLMMAAHLRNRALMKRLKTPDEALSAVVAD